MATIRRLQVALSGAGAVGGGVMTFYNTAVAATGWPAAVKTFLNSAPLMYPAALNFAVPNTGDVLDVDTGQLVDGWSDGALPTPFAGTNTGDWAAGVGIRVVWNTNVIHAGRRLKGSNFLVPVAGGIFDVDGTVDTATVSQVQTAAAAYISSQPQAAVYSRPKPAGRGKNGNLPAVTGFFAPILSASVPDKVSWLRSRRT